MHATVSKQIADLSTWKAKALRAKYQELFGDESRSNNRAYLFRRIAWRLQSLSEGGLSDRARQRAQELANEADLKVRPPRDFPALPAPAASKPKRPAAKRDARLPAVGTVLTRQYRDEVISVTVLKDGFEWSGTRYASLSAIALQATGTRWNGFLFFGLQQREDKRARR